MARDEFSRALKICQDNNFNPGLPMIIHFRGETKEVEQCVYAILELRYNYSQVNKITKDEEKIVFRSIDSFYRMGKSLAESVAYAVYSLDFSRSMNGMPLPNQFNAEEFSKIEAAVQEEMNSNPRAVEFKDGSNKLLNILLSLDPAPSADAFNFTLATFSVLLNDGKSVEDSIKGALEFLRNEYE